MISYFDYFPRKAKTELRTATFLGVDRDRPFPAGIYVFTEYYCGELDCDCQRLLVKVLYGLTEQHRPRDVATISYSWNQDPDSDWAAITAECPNPHLDPLHPQASFADELMDFWYDMLRRDEDYALRLQRHYHELRAALARTAKPVGGASRQRKNGQCSALTEIERKRRQRKLNQRRNRRKSK